MRGREENNLLHKWQVGDQYSYKRQEAGPTADEKIKSDGKT